MPIFGIPASIAAAALIRRAGIAAHLHRGVSQPLTNSHTTPDDVSHCSPTDPTARGSEATRYETLREGSMIAFCVFRNRKQHRNEALCVGGNLSPSCCFRSHKNLRSNIQLEALSSQDDDMYHHRHAPSDASSLDSNSTRRPSTSSRTTDLSIDWDPLRLHPPSHTHGPAPPLRDAFGGEQSPRRYQPRELRHVRSSHTLRQPPSHAPRPQPSSSMVIYGGFDFGFDNKPTSTTSATVSNVDDPRRGRIPSPTPSEASSECSMSIGGGSCASDLDDEMLGLGVGGLAPAPASRVARPRPRPGRAHHLAGPSGLLDSDAENFLRRGGWKRRGIVFVSSSPLAGEEEVFEI
ncbi:hypothetical protein N658DRAFT_485164 [Parathielavia hyrcaniae]|uniref:Uncharacterized protein n=1 Tax=Parathielavia hyrcaniae TaxID=113614 RepID=A0AAN6Q665_9PEZI|nr:hypothetical protein N658DRAFT_485164 [Parathielavia hyrcaniae]